MTNAFDAIVVGAGPAGSFAAWKLAKAGKKTLLIDQAKELKRKVCGEYLCPAGTGLLEREGLHELTARFPPVRGMQLFSSRGTQVSTTFSQGFGLALNRKDFDNALLDLARGAGVSVRMNTRLTELSAGERVTAVTSGGVFQADVLIGADGRGSVVSRHFENDLKISSPRVALHAFVHSVRANARIGEMHLFADGSYIGIDPTGDHEVNFSLVCDGSKVKALGGPHAALQNYVDNSANLSARFNELPRDLEITAVSPVQHTVRSVIPNRLVALIGDAAGFVDPLTGEGIYNGLLSARLVSEALIGTNDTAVALKNYARKHRQLLKQKERLNRIFQFVIRRPQLVEVIGKYLSTSQRRADAFIGIVGNIHSPLRGLVRMI